jgi:hypothetical protein
MLKYNNFSLIKPNESQSEKITQVIEENNGSVFHEVDLNEIVQTNFKSDLYYLVDNSSNITCLCPIHVTKEKFGVKRFNCNPLGDMPYAGFVGKALIDINKFSIGPFESIKYAGFPYVNDTIHKKDETLNIGETNMVDLSLDEDTIFSTIIHSKRRNMIRKASKSGITIKSFYSEEGLRIFWPILDELHKKLGYSNYTYDYYNKILKKYANTKQAFILIAYKEQEPISGIFVIGNKNYMHYYKGAGVFGVKNEGQGELLQWEAIKISKLLGVKYYDLCNLDKDKLPAIYRFKTGISQQIIQYKKYRKNSLGYKILSKI